MSEERMVKVVNFLLLVASLCIFNGVVYLILSLEEPKQTILPEAPVESMVEEEKEIYKKRKVSYIPNALSMEMELRNQWMFIPIEYIVVETEYLCRGYITAYCAEECGWNYSTSSGAICHYSDDWTEPTTCAIDRNYFSYGDLFMIDGKIYIAEDTGSAVKGLHWDLYRESMDEVNYFGSHYADVYGVEFVKYESERRFLHEYFSNYLLRSLYGNWFLFGPSFGISVG